MKLLPLTRGYFAKVDDDVFDLVSASKWRVIERQRNNYASRVVWRNGKRTSQFLHRMLMSEPPCIVDHRDHDGLNNQNANLRFSSGTGNSANRRKMLGARCPYKGLAWDNIRNEWQCRVRLNGEYIYAGRFKVGREIDGAKAYDALARKIFGDFAELNFP